MEKEKMLLTSIFSFSQNVTFTTTNSHSWKVFYFCRLQMHLRQVVKVVAWQRVFIGIKFQVKHLVVCEKISNDFHPFSHLKQDFFFWKRQTVLSRDMLLFSGSVVSVSDSWPGGCEFDPRLKRLFFPAYFRLSPLQKHVRKVVGGFGKKSCVSTGGRKPGNTCASPTAMIWP